MNLEIKLYRKSLHAIELAVTSTFLILPYIEVKYINHVKRQKEIGEKWVKGKHYTKTFRISIGWLFFHFELSLKAL